MAKEHLGKQFVQDEDDDGPYCPNCSDDMGVAFDEWPSREEIHPLKRIPCKGCGAI